MDKEEKYKSILPEQVKSNNSNLYRYSNELAKELWKCRGNQNAHKESHSPKNIADYVILQKMQNKDIEDPYPHLDFQIDFEKFIEVYPEEDQKIFIMWIQGYTQAEIAEKMWCSQQQVSVRLAFMKEEYEYYYYGENNE